MHGTRKRGPTEIIAEILNVASRGATTKTSLVYKVNLNFTRIAKYLELLAGKRMIETYRTFGKEGDSPTCYRTTEIGLMALKMLRDSNGLIFGDRKLEEDELSIAA